MAFPGTSLFKSHFTHRLLVDAYAPLHACPPQRSASPEEAPETAREASPPINFGVDLLANQKPLLTPQMLPMAMPPARDITRGGAGADTHEEERRHPPVNPS